MDIQIKTEEGRLYIITAGGEAELLYRVEGEVISIYHTFVPESERGRGIAEKLAFAGFELAEKKGFKVRADCHYISHFVEKHPELRNMIESAPAGI